MGKLLHVFPYLSLTSEVPGDSFVHAERRPYQNTAAKPPCRISVCHPREHLHVHTFHTLSSAQGHAPTHTVIHSRFHKAGRHEGSLTKDCGSAGRKWNTPLDLNRKQPGKEDSDRTHMHTHTQSESYSSMVMNLNTDHDIHL